MSLWLGKGGRRERKARPKQVREERGMGKGDKYVQRDKGTSRKDGPKVREERRGREISLTPSRNAIVHNYFEYVFSILEVLNKGGTAIVQARKRIHVASSILALVQVLADPVFCTIEGFLGLLEKEFFNLT
jgi:hypothetical protein